MTLSGSSRLDVEEEETRPSGRRRERGGQLRGRRQGRGGGSKWEVRDDRVEKGTWERRGGFKSGSGCSEERRRQGC